jgi:predicted HTH transcriptional regulator
MCDDCLMDVGLNPHNCDPWAEYVDTADRKRHGLTGSAGLTEAEKNIYDFVKEKGKATRQQVMAGLNLSATELEDRLTALLHNELVKEASEVGKQYLVVIG